MGPSGFPLKKQTSIALKHLDLPGMHFKYPGFSQEKRELRNGSVVPTVADSEFLRLACYNDQPFGTLPGYKTTLAMFTFLTLVSGSCFQKAGGQGEEELLLPGKGGIEERPGENEEQKATLLPRRRLPSPRG